MAAVGDRAALLSYQGDEESLGLTFHPTGVSPKYIDSSNGRRALLSRRGKRTLLTALLKLNVVTILTTLVLVVLFGGFFAPFVSQHVLTRRLFDCNSVENGYQCHQPYAQLWGQYSPFTSLKTTSVISPDVPPGCTITFAQVLSRHGARYPTASKTKTYAELIDRIQKTSKSYKGAFKFLETFKYKLGSDNMTQFGESQLFNSGSKFYKHYQALAKEKSPFIRASGSPRIIKSAEMFIQGFHQYKLRDPDSDHNDGPPVIGVIIPEGSSSNNTLDHAVCDKFEEDRSGDGIQQKFADKFIPQILERVKSHLPGASVTIKDVSYLMDLCSFHTVAMTPDASIISPFCQLFTIGEWVDYDYYQSLGKYYRYGPGHPLGPEQGIGYSNELIARLTNTPVKDNTSTNRTLDSDPATFPLNATLYADFSHDNTMTSIFAALGLFNGTKALPVDRVQTPVQSNGYSASWTVPFAARAYIEKMKCEWSPRRDAEYVRILINDRVFPLHGCKVDVLGRCELNDFVAGLSFAMNGGKWETCST
ncbi:histidine phosphatase family protein [Emydomyces testavorans]|uniref:Phytase A n=1 Tax=Emydomyces testavorans TaxID=2070801 RepID=A0AAF0DIQ2_9EURO|nr:histidine phosphatase family protein [Emydomyces testavorans]